MGYFSLLKFVQRRKVPLPKPRTARLNGHCCKCDSSCKGQSSRLLHAKAVLALVSNSQPLSVMYLHVIVGQAQCRGSSQGTNHTGPGSQLALRHVSRLGSMAVTRREARRTCVPCHPRGNPRCFNAHCVSLEKRKKGQSESIERNCSRRLCAGRWELYKQWIRIRMD